MEQNGRLLLLPSGQPGLDDVESTQHFSQHVADINLLVTLSKRQFRLAGLEAHPGWFTPTSDDQTLSTEHAERALHRAEGYPVVLRHLLLPGKSLTRLVPGLRDRRAQVICHLLERLPGVIWINSSHAGQPTQLRHLGRLADVYLAYLSKSSILDVVSGVAGTAQVLATHETTPAGAGTPAGAYTEPLGETMQVNGTRMLRVRAVADMFDVSVSTIYRAIEAGQLASLKIGSGKGAIRIPAQAVEAFAALCAGMSDARTGQDGAVEHSTGGAA